MLDEGVALAPGEAHITKKSVYVGTADARATPSSAGSTPMRLTGPSLTTGVPTSSTTSEIPALWKARRCSSTSSVFATEANAVG